MKGFALFAGVVALALFLSACQGPQGPQGEAGLSAGEGPFGFALDGGPAVEIRGLSAFAGALRAGLEESYGGQSPEDPLSLAVTGLNLSRSEELVALYSALVRHVDLDLGGCGGIMLAAVPTALYRENRERIVSQTLPASIQN